MGHRFQLRHTLGQPIFLQFLDAVYQLLQQHPAAFEFTPAFLRDLWAIHDGRPPYGSRTPLDSRAPFDADCDAQRDAQCTALAWDFLLDEKKAPSYVNTSFIDAAASASSAAAAEAEAEEEGVGPTSSSSSSSISPAMSPISIDTHAFALRVWEPLRTASTAALPQPSPSSRGGRGGGGGGGGGLACCLPAGRPHVDEEVVNSFYGNGAADEIELVEENGPSSKV